MRHPPTGRSSGFSPSKVRRGERIARPLHGHGRIRREHIQTEYAEDFRDEAEPHTIRPGDAFKRERSTDTQPHYFVYLGVSAEDRSCLYLHELGPATVGTKNCEPKLVRRDAWLADFSGGHSSYEPIPLDDAVASAYSR